MDGRLANRTDHFISAKTAAPHPARITKIGVSSRSAAVLWAMQNAVVGL